MTARDALAAGNLTEALTLADGTDAAGQLFRVELLALSGRYRDARTELDAILSDDPAWPAARRSFRGLLRAAHRRTRKPALLADAPRHLKLRWNASRRTGEAALAALDRAEDATPHLFGHIDGREFDGLRDADDRTASVLELFVRGNCVWLPWEQLRRISLEPARHPLDAAFRPARIRLSDSTEFRAHVPLVYVGSHHDDDFALGLETDFTEVNGLTHGLGAKLLFAGDSEVTLGDCTQIDVRGATL